MADLIAEADRQAIHLTQVAQRTRDLIAQSHQLLATQAADLAIRQQLERDRDLTE